MSTLLLLSMLAQSAVAYEVVDALHDAAQAQRVPYSLLYGICVVESGLKPRSVHHADGDGTPSFGLCQIKEKTARWLGFKGEKQELLDPRVNAIWSAKYVRYLMKRYGRYQRWIAAAYNAGSLKWAKDGQLANEKYVNKVLKEVRLCERKSK